MNEWSDWRNQFSNLDEKTKERCEKRWREGANMKCRHPSPSFANITRDMVLAVKCDSRSECLGGLDEKDCNTDLVTYLAGEFCINYVDY